MLYTPEEQPTAEKKPGLREKKKQKTRLTLQRQALRLFREQGYHATTIEQIAEASDISPSTFFRYFGNKEALVFEDDYDPMFVEAFGRQPLDLSPIQALRATIKEGLSQIGEEEQAEFHERAKLMMAVPELRAASLIYASKSLQILAEMMADRLGRPRDDFEVLTFAGAVFGIMQTVQHYCSTRPNEDFFTKVDEALADLEAGLLLGRRAPQRNT